jgi:DNA-binding GntR family transcriptional regulator
MTGPALHLYLQPQDAETDLGLHFLARILQDALTEALPAYWRHRAQQLEDAAPKLGEFHGNATPEELRARWIETAAQACRRHAELLQSDLPDYIADEIADVLGEVA